MHSQPGSQFLDVLAGFFIQQHCFNPLSFNSCRFLKGCLTVLPCQGSIGDCQGFNPGPHKRQGCCFSRPTGTKHQSLFTSPLFLGCCGVKDKAIHVGVFPYNFPMFITVLTAQNGLFRKSIQVEDCLFLWSCYIHALYPVPHYLYC